MTPTTASVTVPNVRPKFRTALFVALPIVVSFFLAWKFFLPIPVYDYWDVLNQSLTLSGQGAFEHLAFYWAPFADQKMFFPKLLIDRLIQATSNRHYAIEIMLGILCQLLVLCLFKRFIAASEEIKPEHRSLLFIFCSWLLFWPVEPSRFQHHWYSTQYSLVLGPGLLSIYLLQKNWGTWTGILLAAPVCAVSIYSHGTGAVLPIAIAVALSLAEDWNARKRLAWWVFTIACLSSIAMGVPTRSDVGLPPVEAGRSIPARILYFTACLAPPLWKHVLGWPLVVVAVEFVRVLFKKKRKLNQGLFPWLVILLWCLGTAALTAIARGGFEATPKGVYFSFFVLFSIVVAYASLLLTAIRDHPLRHLRHTKSKIFVAILLVVLYGNGTVVGIRKASRHWRNIKWSQCMLNFAPILTDMDTKAIFPWRRFRTEILPNLARMKAFPELINTSPFENRDPIGFAVSVGPNVAATADGFQLRMPGHSDFIIITPKRAIPREAVVSLDIDTPGLLHGYYQWDDGRGWSPERALPPYRIGGSYWLFFCDRGKQGSDPIRALRLVFTPSNEGEMVAYKLLPQITVWKRAPTPP